MAALLEVILPVFLVIGFGYAAVWRGYFPHAGVDGLMVFTQQFAIPCLVFRAMSGLDLDQGFSPALLGSFYGGAAVCFLLGLFGARRLFGRPWEDSVAIGFGCMFSNTVLLGLPITERAYGADALVGNYAIIALHSPFGYVVGITVMEAIRARGKGLGLARLASTILRAVFRNALILGILAGLAVNLSGLALPGPLTDALDLMIRAAIPAALFGLGGVLVRYRPEGDMGTIAAVIAVSLLVHPALVWGLGQLTGLGVADLRSAVLTAAMAPGANVYLFANMYGVARRVAVSSVLIGTAATLLSAWMWLSLLP